MRVLEPHYFTEIRQKRKKASHRHRKLMLICVVVLALIVGYVIFGQGVNLPKSRSANQPAVNNAVVDEKPKVLKQFTADQFRALYNAHNYPNTEPITEAPEITGDATADKRIRDIAVKRGYKLTATPVSSIVKTNEPGLEGDDLMQPNALIAWQKLKSAAADDDQTLKMTSAYRSIDYQRTLFLRRLQAAGVNVGRILEGYADDEIEGVLSRAAIPGYSRHHTGYTMDLSCNGVGLENFINTPCYKWLSKNNFENTKKYGWVPSYPDGIGQLGPEPESWEFVWVGTSSLYQ